jgi:hypothetical protein
MWMPFPPAGFGERALGIDLASRAEATAGLV